MIMKQKAIVAGLLVSAVFVPGFAYGAETATDGATEQPASADVGVEDIVVTAERRESRLQDTPISVTAISAAGLEARGIGNLNAIDTAIPNLQLNNGRPDAGGSAVSATIRGVGQNDFQFPNDPGVGMYIDGVYLARTIGGLMSILDVERIEVLRGPQGTLFGRNTIGGAISITTQPPTDELEGSVSLTYGSYNRVEAKGSLNIPLVDGKLAARITAGYIRADGLGKQILTGVELGKENRQIFRIAVRATPSDDVTIDLAADYTRQRQNGGALTLIPNFPSTAGLVEGLFNPVLADIQNAQLGLPAGTQYDSRWASPNRYDNYGTAPMRDWFDAGGGSVTVAWHASDALTLKSITAIRALKAEIFNDLDLSPYSIISTADYQNQEQYSQELQAYGTLFDGRVDYLFGGYYFKEIARDHNTIPIFPGTLDAFGFEISQVADLNLDVVNYAAFGQVGIRLVDGLKLNLGFRQNYERKRFTRQFTHLQGGDIFIPYQILEKAWSSFTPKIGLDWKVNEDILLYVNYAEGFKGGGWNPRPIGANLGVNPFEPETIKTYEIGAKTQWLDRRLTLNVAGFHSIYSAIQMQVLVPPLNSDTQNAGTSSIWGAEVELVARPVPEASIQVSAGFLSNKYIELLPTSDVKITDKLPDAPRWTLSAGADYQIGVAGFGTVTPRIDVSYRSKSFKDAVNSPLIVQPGYWLVSGRIAIKPSGLENFEIQVYGTNLFDTKYISYGQDVGVNGVAEAAYGRPRELGVTAKYRF